MTTARQSHVIRLLAVLFVENRHELGDLRTALPPSMGERVTVLTTPPGTPWLLIQTTNISAEDLGHHIGIPHQITELTTRVITPDPATTAELVAAARLRQRLVVGRAAAERALQRRRLDILVIATDISDTYRGTVERILTSHQYPTQVIHTQLTRTELGQLAGCRRAGCLGITRGCQTTSLAR